MKRIGVLGIHGSVEEHEAILRSLGVEVVRVRAAEDLVGLDGIIIPGGESTTLSKLMQRFGLFEPLRDAIAGGLPTWGTCAGAILLAKEVDGKNPPPTLGLMDIRAERNAYGTQQDSFVAQVEITLPSSDEPHIMEAIFIRAPKLTPLAPTEGSSAKEIITVLASHNEQPILMQQGNLLVSSFHPELSGDTRIHKHFLSIRA